MAMSWIRYLGKVADSFAQGGGLQALPQLHPLDGARPQGILFLSKHAPACLQPLHQSLIWLPLQELCELVAGLSHKAATGLM